MAKLSIVAGATSQSVNVFVRDSSSTTGAGLASVAPAGGSLLTGTKLYYSFTGANASAGVAVSLSVLAAVNSAWSSAGIVTIDGTNMIGWVRIDIPNAALTTAKGRVVSFLLFGGTNMAPTPFEIELTGWDNQSTTDGGLSKLTSLTFTGANKVDASCRDWAGTTITSTSIPVGTAAGAAGGLFISGANTGPLSVSNGVSFTGLAASGATPATAGLTLTGGAASTTGGGVSAPGLTATGGAGAASTNGAAEGFRLVGGGTVTVSGASGMTSTGTGNLHGVSFVHAGSGFDFNATTTPLTLAKTTNITGFNDITAAAAATGVWQDTTSGDFTVSGSIGKSLFTAGAVPGAANGLLIAGTNAATTFSGLTTGALSATTITASGAVAFQSTFTVTGTTTLTGAVSLGSTLGVTGATTLAGLTTGAISATTITASGAVAFQSTFSITGNMSLADGFTITCSTLNRSAISATGNGTGHGMLLTSGSGATGDGFRALSVATIGNGMSAFGSGGGDGAEFAATVSVANASASGLHGIGNGSGNGIYGQCATGGSGDGIAGNGFGAGHGMHLQGGTTSSSAFKIESTAGNAHGIELIGFGTGKDLFMNTAGNNTAISITSNLKKNQAITAFPFLMTDSTTHAPKSGLGSAVTVTRSLDGGGFSAGTLGAVTEIANGWYWCSYAAGDTNGNMVAFRATAAAADDLDLSFATQP